MGEKSFKVGTNSLITSIDYLNTIGNKNYADVNLQIIPEVQEPQIKSSDRGTVIDIINTEEAKRLMESGKTTTGAKS